MCYNETMEKTKEYYVKLLNLACKKIAPDSYLGETAEEVEDRGLRLFEMMPEYSVDPSKKDKVYYKKAYNFLTTFYCHENSICPDSFRAEIKEEFNKNFGLEK